MFTDVSEVLAASIIRAIIALMMETAHQGFENELFALSGLRP
jgi:hypothetical protein